MKKTISILLVATLLLLTLTSCGKKDNQLYIDKNEAILGKLKWGMTVDEAVNALGISGGDWIKESSEFGDDYCIDGYDINGVETALTLSFGAKQDFLAPEGLLKGFSFAFSDEDFRKEIEYKLNTTYGEGEADTSLSQVQAHNWEFNTTAFDSFQKNEKKYKKFIEFFLTNVGFYSNPEFAAHTQGDRTVIEGDYIKGRGIQHIKVMSLEMNGKRQSIVIVDGGYQAAISAFKKS